MFSISCDGDEVGLEEEETTLLSPNWDLGVSKTLLTHLVEDRTTTYVQRAAVAGAQA